LLAFWKKYGPIDLGKWIEEEKVVVHSIKEIEVDTDINQCF
jgi:endogenous inhibitor of DNA gyrase (YacG/DUF329 family)